MPSVRQLLGRHKIFLAVVSFIFITFPAWLSSVWTLFSSDPPYHWLQVNHPDAASWLPFTVPTIGVVLLLIIVAEWIAEMRGRSSASGHSAIAHADYKEQLYQDIRWTWNYDKNGIVNNFAPRCTEHHAVLTITPTGRILDPASGDPFRGYHATCPLCGDKIVAKELLSHHMALDRDEPPQGDLVASAFAVVEGQIHARDRARQISSDGTSPPLTVRVDPENPFDVNINGAFFWRIEVTSTSPTPTIDCTAYLIKIERDGEEKWGAKKAALTFEPGSQENTCKTINPRATEILDVIMTREEEVCPATWPRGHWPYFEKLHTIFEATGSYTLTIVIEAKNMKAATFQYRFTKDHSLIDDLIATPLTFR